MKLGCTKSGAKLRDFVLCLRIAQTENNMNAKQRYRLTRLATAT